ncbi:MAG: MOSC domain-containing protein [Gammaproteobacteria bacterium]|nr:MOSC domain-containing protein [Gammaproteobacteria bacterium]
MPKRISQLFSWLNEWDENELLGRLVDLFVADEAGAPMRRLTQCACLPGRGLDGDRYATGRGHWIKTDGCEVTLVTRADIARANRRGGQSFDDGAHRRNLVVEGIPLEAYRRRGLLIGEVRFAFHRLRPPCRYLDRLTRPGAGKALGRGAGIGLYVLSSGVIRVGDPVRLVDDVE